MKQASPNICKIILKETDFFSFHKFKINLKLKLYFNDILEINIYIN